MTNKTIHARGRLLPILFLGVLMAALDIAIVGPALPAIRETFALSERTVAWVFNVWVLFNLVGLGLMARLSDVLGRREVYAVCVFLFGIGSLVVALAPTFAVVLTGRGVQGLAASGIFPVASAVIGDTYTPDRRGRALGILGAVYGLAFIIGPIIAGLLLPVGWTWLFLVNLPVATVAGLFGYRMLPAGRTTVTKPLDWRGILIAGILLASLAYGVNRIDTDDLLASLSSLAVWPFLVLSLALVPVFLRIERRASDPLVRLSLFDNRQVVIAGLLAAGAGLTEAAFIFLPALAVDAFGVSKSAASFMLLPLVCAVALGAPLGGRVLDRVGSRVIILAGTTLLTIGLLLVGLFPDVRLGFYAGTVLIGLGLAALLGSSLSYILLNEAREEERTVAQGIITLCISVGQLVGGALIGALAASGDHALAGFARAFLVIAGVACLLTVLSFRLKPRQRERESRMPS